MRPQTASTPHTPPDTGLPCRKGISGKPLSILRTCHDSVKVLECIWRWAVEQALFDFLSAFHCSQHRRIDVQIVDAMCVHEIDMRGDQTWISVATITLSLLGNVYGAAYTDEQHGAGM